MEYVQLGRTGTRVSRVCLGAFNFGRDDSTDAADLAGGTIAAALDAGVNFIDTANIYNQGRSEEVVGRALRDRRHEVVLATKFYGAVGTGPNDYGASRRHVIMQCEASLRRLGTDWIDLYQQHRPDATTPIDETLEALDDLVRAGKIRYFGVSTFPAWQTMEALAVGQARGFKSVPISDQPPYNLLDRRIEREVLPLAEKHGLAILPWSPLAGGLLTGKYGRGKIPAESRFTWWMPGDAGAPQRFRAAARCVTQVAEIAAGASLTLLQVALGWMAARPGVTSVIIGPRDEAQLALNLDGLDTKLTPEVLDALDLVAPPGEAVFPL